MAKPGDIVAFCPDQLGPAVYRVIDDPAQYNMTTFPRGTGPEFVDWVNYAKAVHAARPPPSPPSWWPRPGPPPHLAGLAARVPDLRRQVPGVGGDAAATSPPLGGHNWVTNSPGQYYEPMNLTEYAPRLVTLVTTLTRAPSARTRARQPVGEAILPFVVARAVVFGALGLAHFVVDRPHPSAAGVAARVHEGLLGWDAGYYETIARVGYHPLGRSRCASSPPCPP